MDTTSVLFSSIGILFIVVAGLLTNYCFAISSLEKACIPKAPRWHLHKQKCFKDHALLFPTDWIMLWSGTHRQHYMQNRLVGLGLCFSLGVQEVPGSIPTQDQAFSKPFCLHRWKFLSGSWRWLGAQQWIEIGRSTSDVTQNKISSGYSAIGFVLFFNFFSLGYIFSKQTVVTVVSMQEGHIFFMAHKIGNSWMIQDLGLSILLSTIQA